VNQYCRQIVATSLKRVNAQFRFLTSSLRPSTISRN